MLKTRLLAGVSNFLEGASWPIKHFQNNVLAIDFTVISNI